MNNQTINKLFLSKIDTDTKNDILISIAQHYGITTDEVLEELMDDEAEHILDYLSGSSRTATSVIMQRHGF